MLFKKFLSEWLSPSLLLMLTILKPRWLKVCTALGLFLIASALESTSTVLVLPLLQSLLGIPLITAQTPKFLGLINGFYANFLKEWHLVSIIGSILGITVIKNLVVYISNVRIHQLRLQFGDTVRRKCIEKLLQLDILFYSQAKVGELMAYTNEHTQRSENVVLYVMEAVADAVNILSLLVVLLTISPTLTLIATFSLLFLGLVLRPLIKSVQIQGELSARATESFSALVTEIITGMRVIKSFHAEERELKRATKALFTRYKSEIVAHRLTVAIAPVTETVGITVLLLLLGCGSFLLAQNNTEVVLPTLLTFTLVLMRILPRVNHVNSLRSHLSFVSGSLDAIFHFLNSNVEQAVPEGDKVYTGIQSAVKFQDVSFTFPGNSKPTLEDINFTIIKGTTTAIVGTSGSGKSTLADLLMRFHCPHSGNIYIDNIDLQDFQSASWRQAVALVSQDTFLFNTSVRENIAYSYPEATEFEVIEAAKKAHAYEFIQDLPEQLDTIVGNRGAKLSGGQRQRIAIARAILKNPDLLILDEATSALDNNSERIVQQAIEEVSRDRTVIIIAHRLSTIEKAHNIIVLRHGRVVEQGTHEQLLASSGEYASLYQMQSEQLT